LPSAESSSGNVFYRWDGADLLLQIWVLPRASRDCIMGIHNNCLRVKLTTAPVDGKANQSLIKFLSKQLGVSASQISIEKGETSKTKQIRIRSLKSLPEILKNIN